jgi:hypothetical protein
MFIPLLECFLEALSVMACSSVIASHLWFGNDVLSKWFYVWETGKSLLGLSPENRVDGAQRMSDVLPDNCGWGATNTPRILH